MITLGIGPKHAGGWNDFNNDNLSCHCFIFSNDSFYRYIHSENKNGKKIKKVRKQTRFI
jgi:hypothetical protein